ncbi:hypothetical protein BC831DRAFT_462118 [Entophlyctis helioformis]|nr:hypothetical protein BC831DRAFT_462118 [Entophlyctis helioformis]
MLLPAHMPTGARCSLLAACTDGRSLSDRNLAGPIPATLGALTSLDRLSLWGNQFSGPIPSSLASLSRLSILYLHDNLLSGEVPSFLGTMKELTWTAKQLAVGIHSTGTGRLPNLTGLSLSNNNISGSIPSELGQLPRLEKLLLRGNRLSGPIPDTLSKLLFLQILWLDGNSLTGQIPSSIDRLGFMKDFSFANNPMLAGSLPDNIPVNATCNGANTAVCASTESARARCSLSAVCEWQWSECLMRMLR